MQETLVQSLGREDPLQKGQAPHSSILAWRVPWPIESMGSQRVGHDWAAFTSPLQPSGGEVMAETRTEGGRVSEP